MAASLAVQQVGNQACTAVLAYLLRRLKSPGLRSHVSFTAFHGVYTSWPDQHGDPERQHAMASAGVLYPAGDYAEALRLTRKLVEDMAARKTMGATARAEVERLGWLAAIRRVRDSQYQRAINTYRAHKRSACRILRFGSSTKVLAERMQKYNRIS